MSVKHLFQIKLLLSLFLLFGCNKDQNELKKSIAIIHVAKQAIDFDAPWISRDVKTEIHQAVYLGNNRWLTTGFAVKGAVNIQMQKEGNPYRVDAKIVSSDFDINLAVIEPTSKADSFEGFKAVSISGEDIDADDSLQMFSTSEEQRLEAKKGHFVKLSQRSSVVGPYMLPTLEIEMQSRKEMGWSEPVFRDNKLIGISTGTSDRFLTALSGQVIKRFVKDFDSGEYRGLGSIGIQIAPLTSPFHRQMLGAKPALGGVLIKRVFVGSSFSGILQPQDILIEISGQKIDERGYIKRGEQRIHFTYLVASGLVGDKIGVKVIRDGKELSLQGTLGKFDSTQTKIPYFRRSSEPFVIFGGFIFQELTQGFLKIWGKNWRDKSPPEFLMLWDNLNYFEKSTDERVVILNRVLPDQINRGYERLKYLIVGEVNGEAVVNLEQFRTALVSKPVSKNGGKFAVFNFKLDGGEIVLPYKQLKDSHQRIRRQYNIADESGFVGVQ